MLIFGIKGTVGKVSKVVDVCFIKSCTPTNSNKKKSSQLTGFLYKIVHCLPVLAKNYTLISTSTPLGSSSFINASTVFDDELYMSSNLLCALN